MRMAKSYEVQVRVRLRVLAGDEDEATRAVSAEVVEQLAPLLEELHSSDPRFAGFSLHADELVDELDH
jgi:5-carboxymethyl-2-hydroxymuconate isomerase